jgi:hypothetical protein
MIQLIAWLLSQRLFWAALAVVGGPALFVRGFRLLERKRLIMDIPRSTIRSAALGPIEISGKAVGPYTLVAPISRSDCLYYRVAVQSNLKADQKNWKMRELCAPLFLDDGTGKVMIYPAHCDLEATEQREDCSKAGLALAGLPLGGDAEFLQEYCIRPGDQLFVLGDLQENPWAKCDESSELSRIGPGFVSEDEADLLRLSSARKGNSGQNRRTGTRVRLSSFGDPDERPRSLRDFHGESARDCCRAGMEVFSLCLRWPGGCTLGIVGDPESRQNCRHSARQLLDLREEATREL